jgi:hypothetical protein
MAAAFTACEMLERIARIYLLALSVKSIKILPLT